MNQQIEVREVTTSCAAAGQGTGSFDSQANAGEGAGATPANILCYGKGPLIESNLYGPDGMRATRHVEKVAGGVRVATDSVYVRLGGNVVKEYTEELRAPTSAAPELSHEKAYVYGPLGLLATEELCNFNCKSDESAGLNVTRYYEYDHLGTIRAITDDKGKLTATFDYEPFGLELKSVGIDWWTDASSNTHRFTGHEREFDGAGLPFADYMKARMYGLNTARFDQTDPKFAGPQDPQNWCSQSYVRNMPVNFWDPTGNAAVARVPGWKAQGFASYEDCKDHCKKEGEEAQKACVKAHLGRGAGILLGTGAACAAEAASVVGAPACVPTAMLGAIAYLLDTFWMSGCVIVHGLIENQCIASCR